MHGVARGMGLDGRIGRKFLHAGPGYGGSCFPKDTLALARTAEDAGSPLRLVETTIAVNEARKAADGGARGRGPGRQRGRQDDRRARPDLQARDGRHARGAVACPCCRRWPPPARRSAPSTRRAWSYARPLLPAGVHYAANALDAAEGADALVLLTEWNEFRALSPARLRGAMRGNVLLDFRNVYDPEAMRAEGFRYHSIGRP